MSEQAIVFAPLGDEAEQATAILAEAGLPAASVHSIEELVAALAQGAAYAIVTEEALRKADLRPLVEHLSAQPEWSGFPFILLTTSGGAAEPNPIAARHVETLGNVTFLERPFHPTTLVSLARAALRARRRQDDARGRLETIRRSEERLRLALSAGRLGAWALALPSLELTTSDLCREQYGRAPDEAFAYADLVASIHPEDWPGVRKAMRRAQDGTEDYDVEYRCVWRDGTVRWLQVRGRADPSAAGAATTIAGVSLDISERKLAEAALSRSEARFRAAVEAVRGVLWTNNAAGEMVGEQPGWAGLTGQAFEDYQGLGWSRAVHPDDAQPTIDAWSLAVAEQRPFVFEHRVRRLDESWGAFSIRAIPVLRPDGQVREWVGVHTDITEQRAAERELADLAATLEERVIAATAELKSSQARLRSIFETSYQFFGEMTPEGILIDANATSLRAIEATLGDVVGRPFAETPWFSQTPGAADMVRDTVARVAAGETVRQEITVKLPGGWRTFDFSMRPVRDADGTVVALVPEAMDLTDRREAEETLRQAQKLETIGQLTGGVAHDFNNLLTPIVGSLDILSRMFEGDERAQRLAAAGLQSAERARILIDRLLAFARRQTLNPQPTDVGELIGGMSDLLSRTLGSTIAIETHLPRDAPLALLDPNQFELSILNLCVNARDAMAQGGLIRIEVAAETSVGPHAAKIPPGDYVRVSVADSGSGMDAETAARAVEPFYTTKDVGKGTGLGLSMVHGLVAQLGGGMAIESSMGAGTTVSLFLPATARRALPRTPAPATIPGKAPTRGASVLLVDDEELVRLALADMLRDAGYEVREAGSGIEARELVRMGLRPDILVTDQLMPGMKGSELANELRLHLPTLRVLVATGYADLPDVGFPRIAKPFAAPELVERVRGLVEEAAGGAEPRD